MGHHFLNTPTAVNLGNPGNMLHHPRDITIIKYCDQITGFVVNGNPSYNDVLKLDFKNDLSGTPSITSFGNIGNFSFPHSISKLFRVGADVYSFITNVDNNTITRLKFSGCTNSSIPNSTAQNPPDVTYDKPGIYNINLSVDEGLPTQTSFCRQVVVLDTKISKSKDTTICRHGKAQLNVNGGTSYHWSPSTGLSDPAISNPVASPDISTKYFVTVKNGAGCEATDSIVVTVRGVDSVKIKENATGCSDFDFNGIASVTGGIVKSWQWFFGDGASANVQNTSHNYNIKDSFTVRLIVTDENNCKDSAVKKINLQSISPDYTYEQSLCNPLIINFQAHSGSSTPHWSFGDGETNNNSFSISHTYKTYGNYLVKYSNADGLCSDTTTKTIIVNVNAADVIVSKDAAICLGDSLELKSNDNLAYCWSPSADILLPGIANPVVYPKVTTTYRLNTYSLKNNLIINGDFSQGNQGFSSAYAFASVNTVEGEYSVGPSPLAWNSSMSSCSDKTQNGGNGYMMLVNGSPQTNLNVWSQTVSVKPNTNYAFSTWIQTISALQNPAQLQFSINGKLIGKIFKSNDNVCVWERFYESWNSANNTTAVISIVNMNEERIGNDFALDDISFAELTLNTDSVTIRVITPPIVNLGRDTAICNNDSLLLNAGNSGANYIWQDNSNTQTYWAGKPGTYTVKVTNQGGCAASDTLKLEGLASPVVTLRDTATCPGYPVQLNAQSPGTNIYQWQSSPTLSATGIPNPVASPADTTTYFISVTNEKSCVTKDSVTIAVVPKPVITARADTSVCFKSTFQLWATGSNVTHYSWSPGKGLTDSTQASTTAAVINDANTTYTVTAFNDGCSVTDNVQITALHLPNIQLSLKDTLICAGGSAQLHVSGGVVYLWSPVSNIDNVSSQNPFVNPTSETWYHVKVTGDNTCANIDSVHIRVNPKPVFAISPKDPSLCIGESVQLTASGGDVYSWSPVATVQNPYSASSLVYPTENTVYKVTITNNACHVTDSVFASVSVTTKPEIEITKSNDIDCFLGSTKLEASGGTKYAWSPAATLSNPHSFHTTASPAETTTYYVEVSKNGSCKATDSIQVKVIKDGAQNGYLVASGFTPNGDMHNDCFGIKNWGYVSNLDLSVYNRWGQMVFHTTDPSACWNGMYKNNLQPPGAYVYQIRAKTLCGDVYRKGTIVLIR